MFHPDPARKLAANLYDLYHCCVYGEKTPDDGQRNYPKHVEFYLIYKSQQDAQVTEFILSENCSTCFGFDYHPSSGAQKKMKMGDSDARNM